MNKQHHYNLTVTWTGNNGEGTNNYRSYERSHSISAANKTDINASSDAAFRGDSAKYNPEQLLVAALSSCHMLSYLHLCAINGVIVIEYADNATGIMEETANGSGSFTEVILFPNVVVKDASMIDKASELHNKAHENCFIANSVNFPVHCKASCTSIHAFST